MARWGILSTGKIASDFVSSLKLIPDAKVVACASRTKEAADAFGKKHNIPKCFTSYEQLAADPEVEVIYIGSLHPLHHENALMCLHKGKAVLCEKPLCMNAKQAREVINLAREKKIFLMEAMWTRYLPLYKKLLSLLEEKAIGDVTYVNITFGGAFDMTVPRNHDINLGAGALLDIGVYPISIARFIFDKDPKKIVAVSDLKDGVDQMTSCIFSYDHGQHASLSCSIISDMPCDALVVGTKGHITIHPPCWCSEKMTLQIGDKVEVIEIPHPEVTDQLFFTRSQALHYEAVHVQECLKAGKTESQLWNLDATLAVMETMDKIRALIGQKYPSDE